MATQTEIAVLKERLDWHKKIAWGIVSIYAAVFVGFLTWYLPKELDQQKTAIVDQIRIELNNIARLQLDKVSAQLEAAKASGIKVEPKAVQRLGKDALRLVNSGNPELSKDAWKTVNQIVSYYSFANPVDPIFVEKLEKYGVHLKGTDKNQNCLNISGGPSDLSTNPSLLLIGIVFENCTLHLNAQLAHAVAFRFGIFRNVNVIYEGGQVSLDRVAFINCTFQLPLTPSGRTLGEILLADNDIRNFEIP